MVSSLISNKIIILIVKVEHLFYFIKTLQENTDLLTILGKISDIFNFKKQITLCTHSGNLTATCGYFQLKFRFIFGAARWLQCPAKSYS